MRTLSIKQARRIALASQGFGDSRPKGNVTERHFRRALGRMGILQLDSVNVLCRSHFLPMLARLGPYDQDRLDRWIWRSGENHEYLTHEASITAMDLYPAIRHRMGTRSWHDAGKFEQEHPGYLDAVLNEVRDRGPLSVRDLSDPGDRNGPWWGHSKGKRGLEVLYRNGRLAIHHRTKAFLTVYDVAERVVPPEHLGGDAIDDDEARRQLLMLGARSVGIGTDSDIADYTRQKVTAARPLLQQLVDGGELEEVRVPTWDQRTFMYPEAKVPRSVPGSAMLSPFDPVVWYRPRAERLFNFRYRIEIYVPEAERVFGYYVLPFLLDEELVGRVDMKADRKAGRLLVRAAHLEPSADPKQVAAAMVERLTEMSEWLGLKEIEVGSHGDFGVALRRTLG